MDGLGRHLLSEIRQYCITYIWNIKKIQQTNKCNPKSSHTDTENKLVVTSRKREERSYIIGVGDERAKLLCIK